MDSTKERTCTISWEKESHCSKEQFRNLRGKLISKIILFLKEEIDVMGAANANIISYNLLCHYMAKLPSYDSPTLGALFRI